MLKLTFFAVLMMMYFATNETSVEASEALEFIEENPDYAGKCYCKVTKKAYDVGQSWKDPKKCVRYTCNKNNGKLSISMTGCSKFEVKAPCTSVSGKPSANFPDCCPRAHCPGGQGRKVPIGPN